MCAFRGWAACLSLLLLFGCNGEGGIDGTGNEPSLVLSGKATNQSALANKNFVIRGALGKQVSGTTDANGNYSRNVDALKAPYFIKVESGDGNNFYSVTAAPGKLNINPFTDFLSRNWFASRNRNIEGEFLSQGEILSPPQNQDIADLQARFNTFLAQAYSYYKLDGNYNFFNGSYSNESDFALMLLNTQEWRNANRYTFALNDPGMGFQTIILNNYDISEDIVSLVDSTAPIFNETPIAQSVSDTEVIVLWNAASDNIGVSGYKVYRTDNDPSFPKSVVFPFYIDSGLTAGVQYCYQVEALDAAGNVSARSGQRCVTPQAVDSTPPLPVQSFNTVSIAANAISFTWLPSTSTDVIGYDVFRGNSGAVNTKIATVVSSSYSDLNLQPNQQYCYVIKAFDASGLRSDASAENCATTIDDTAAPVTVASVNAGVYSTAQSVFLTCSDVAGSGCATTYYATDLTTAVSNFSIYYSAIPISVSSSLRFYSVDLAGNQEAVRQVDYVINTAPVANAGNDVTVQINNPIMLDGSGSHDAEQTNLAYSWSVFSGPAGSKAQLSVTDVVNPSFTPDVAGSYTINLIVNDGFVDSAVDSMVVTATALPIANAGPDIPNALVNVSVSLSGSGSQDPLGGTLNYAWTLQGPAGSNAALMNATTVNPSFTPDVAGEFIASLVVSNSAGDSVPDTVSIFAGNVAPVAKIVAPQSAAIGSSVILDGSASSDGNNDKLTYAWTLTPPQGSNALLSDATAVNPRFDVDVVGNYQVSLTVNDTKVDSAPAQASIAGVDSSVEVEPNDTWQQAHPLAQLGYNNPVSAVSSGGSDIDWFSFNGLAGDTYTIEIFDVTVTFPARGTNLCNPNTGQSYGGLAIEVFGSDKVTPLVARCQAVSAGSVHNYLTYQLPGDGTYYIRVSNNYATSPSVGTYGIRVLPNFASGTWNAQQEPNSDWNIAYEILPGANNAVVSHFEPRGANTYSSDVDWFRFNGLMGETYTVEIFDVNVTFPALGTNLCNPNIGQSYGGLAIEVFGSNKTTPLAFQCQAVSAGRVHNYLTYQLPADGTYFIRVSNNYALTASNGLYSIRVLPNFTSGTWDAQQEPNSDWNIAYEILPGANNAVVSHFEPRGANTYSSDVDWFRFNGLMGETYTVEIFDVNVTFPALGTNLCNPNIGQSYGGLAIEVFGSNKTTPLAFQCQAVSAGRVHNYLTYQLPADGTYFIRVSNNYKLTASNGLYSIRVLPNFATGTWDAQQEPNSDWNIAYEILPGANNAVVSHFEPRGANTYSSDVDWFRFNGLIGETYTIEIFDVNVTFPALGTNLCNPNTGQSYGGLAIEVFGSNKTTPLATQCQAVSAGRVHNYLTYQLPADGTYFIRVSNNYKLTASNGLYSIRVLPNFAAGSWDAQQEPNSDWNIAYALVPDAANPVVTHFEARGANTYSSDVDWFRFSGNAGALYTVEISNVTFGFPVGNSTNLCGLNLGLGYIGLAIEAFSDDMQTPFSFSCNNNVVGTVFNTLSLSLPADNDGIYFLRISNNYALSASTGNYSIRVYTTP